MKLSQKVLTIIVILAIALASLGWVAAGLAHAPALSATPAQIGTPAMADTVPSQNVPLKQFPVNPGVLPSCVSWNG